MSALPADAILEAVIFDISSPSNERIKRLVRLGDRRHRDNEGVFVVEGRMLIERAIAAGYQPVELYSNGSDQLESHVEAVTVEPTVLDKASYRKRSQGLIAVFEQIDISLYQIALSSNPLLLVAEAVEKPGNLGALVRAANGAGADGVVTVSADVDLFNPNLLRSSTGAFFSTPIAKTDLALFVEYCEKHSIAIVVADPAAEASLYDTDLTGPISVCVGTEDAGVTPELLDLAASSFFIPMHGSADSLNVSTAAAVALYEARRQRMHR